MNRFAIGSAMGFLVGAGVMMMPSSTKLRRTVLKEAERMKRNMKRG